MSKIYMVVITDEEGSEVLFESRNKRQCEIYAEELLLEEGYEASIEVIER